MLLWIGSDKICADFSKKMLQKRLTAGLRRRLDALEELAVLPRPSS